LKQRREGRRRFRRLRRAVRLLCLVVLGTAAAGAAVFFLDPFPLERLEDPPGSPAVFDREGRPLLLLASADGRWHIPVPRERMSRRLRDATVAVEDSRFRHHHGVDVAALGRAALQNVTSARVVSGASTITMQLCRLMEPRPRNLPAKAKEAIRALQLERLLGKDEILECYLNLAPYGGNIHGVEAASRIWLGKGAADLSLAEAALLAGLPQSPTRYRPDLHPDRAAARRRTVLARMLEEGMIDEAERAEAEAAPVVVRPLAGAGGRLSTGFGRHAAWWALMRRPRGGRTTIDLDLQTVVELAARDHAARLPPGSDAAVVVLHVPTGEIRALVGSTDYRDPRDGQVNGALARRSPGSALKPFLYAAAFATGRFGPESTIPDEPIERAGWRPRNFRPGFAGDLSAAECLRRSLNIPALLVTEATGLTRCIGTLRAAGVRLPEGAAGRGGLAIATGAVEVRLLDLTNGYATIGRGGTCRPAVLFPDEEAPESRALSASVCAALDHILSCRARPARGLEGREREQVSWFMWKTGTSSGRRDAWAVGHNGRFAIGVWAGHFSGRGHVEYTGKAAAEPLLATLFQHPMLAAAAEPPPPPALKVRRPFFDKEKTEQGPRILSPTAGAVFLAVDGKAIVHPEGNLDAGGLWFLDDAPLPGEESGRLVLPPGRYELRLVGRTGGAAAVEFTIRAR
jgi:penicillin-binding protein 1C